MEIATGGITQEDFDQKYPTLFLGLTRLARVGGSGPFPLQEKSSPATANGEPESDRDNCAENSVNEVGGLNTHPSAPEYQEEAERQ
jgi:hypothetical protein